MATAAAMPAMLAKISIFFIKKLLFEVDSAIHIPPGISINFK
jgi:hypothetical protein